METKEILELVLEHTGMSLNGLAKAIGLPRSQNLSDIQNGKVKKISVELSEKISNAFPEISRKFLQTGEGEMISKFEEAENYKDKYIEALEKITQLQQELLDKKGIKVQGQKNSLAG